jgi:tetratricopeptide (TPR) repeat protein
VSATVLERDALQRFEALVSASRYGEARGLAAELAAQQPQSAYVALLEARLKRLVGDLEGAAASYQAALERDAALLEAMLELGGLHLRMKDVDKAFDAYSLAIYHDPSSAEAYCGLGEAYARRDETEAAAACFRRAIELDPGMARPHALLGIQLGKKKANEEAIAELQRAIALDPEDPLAHGQLGNLYVRLERYEEARSAYERLCELTPPHHAAARISLSNAMLYLGRYEEVARTYLDLLREAPEHFAVRWNRAHLLLAEHRFKEGWRDYEYRFSVPEVWEPRLIPHPPWRGEPLDGKTLLVSCEQGLGDQFMFASCLPDVIGRAARVVVECHSRIEALFRRSFPDAQVVSSQQEAWPRWMKNVGHVDFHVSMGSLPRHLRNRWEDFPRHNGYLKADPEKVARWRARLDALGPGAKIGVHWRGGIVGTRRSLRSIPLADWMPILGRPGCRFVSLQYGDCRDELEAFRAGTGAPLEHWQEAIDDLDETAALCCALDLTVSVCTSVIHLNGALGRPVWVMVPSAPEWRYGLRGEAMPWYPSVRLFRQATPGDWPGVMARVTAGLDDFVRRSEAR